MNAVRASFASYWQSIQHALFPQLEHVLGPLTGKQQQLVQTLEVIRIEHLIPRYCRPGEASTPSLQPVAVGADDGGNDIG